ncbi:thioredoxin-like I protein Txl1 [Protomyces lactucae-debilis]|uniref:Thioredoxin-like I protein Txl1 n=1 Tax=Protomyces lactucae-debilis TaxID=2754530 RepID=A0A1Y2FU81_PROLT|nr:thioredoxin-like I protein Txl1 [Protomyces lactucae-debilis]ORY87570.1 thioredoxin-like I protein Txl1 [Protomyces lactucae-debilis]
MSVREITTSNDFASLKNNSALLIVDFFATWCGPCKVIAPRFAQLAARPENKGAVFIKVDVDKVRDVAQSCGVTAMPTFQCFHKGKKVDELKGADPSRLDAMIKKQVAKYGAAEGASGDASGSGSGSGSTGSLNGNIDVKQLEMSNATESSAVRALFDPNSKTVVTSDSDEQLMLYIPFQESCKVHSLVVRVNPEKRQHAPSTLKLFVNQPNILSFDDAGSLPATQEITDVQYNEKGEATIALRYVKFQKCISLVVFIEANCGEEEATMLRSIEVLGEVGANNASGPIKKVEDD